MDVENMKKIIDEAFEREQREKLKEERRKRRLRIVSTIARLGPYVIGILWLVSSSLGALEKSEDWMFAGILGAIWILIGVVSSK